MRKAMFIICLFMLGTLGCGMVDAVDKGRGSAERESELWRQTVIDIMGDLEGLEAVTAQHIDEVTQSAIRAASAETRCTTSFVKDMIKAELMEIARSGSYIPIPVVCHTHPSSISVAHDGSVSPRTIEISGYNLDETDSIKIHLVKGDNQGPALNSRFYGDPSISQWNLNLADGNGIRIPKDVDKVRIVTPTHEHDILVLQAASPQPANLMLSFEYIDVYLDGSGGADTWSLWCQAASLDQNGKLTPSEKITVWDRKPEISDNCEVGYGAGPEGDESACRYRLYDSSVQRKILITLEDDEALGIRCWGTAHDNEDDVRMAELFLYPNENWGIGSGGQPCETSGGTCHRLGAANTGQTSYFMYFKVQQLN